ncbi:RNase A-like domain-containing protein [Microvirga mediterraneensis]|uniref:Bacterial CdiA-CT RNAse A domain-containing protein n=1 Tax=Microvirga mediterraneensis TaxID=2754695 RepID=A0A838BN15_9HYPH|nr:RNase A-like domain-containing protein [Microvirga mediterraneensis]MBA1156741.1 hypothetical protein [Microvirga mediterraneensis]
MVPPLFSDGKPILRDWLALKRRLTSLHLDLTTLRLLRALKRFNPQQPRVPAGSPNGGQWTSGDGGSGVGASTDPTPVQVGYREEGRRHTVDLREAEVRGGHAMREHVGKTEAELTGRVEREYWDLRIIELGRKRAGSFFSIGEANEYVNAALDANRAIVEEVAAGREPSAFFTHRLGFVTGREAIVLPERRTIILRRTYGIGVLIIHDKRSPNGFRVHTA